MPHSEETSAFGAGPDGFTAMAAPTGQRTRRACTSSSVPLGPPPPVTMLSRRQGKIHQPPLPPTTLTSITAVRQIKTSSYAFGSSLMTTRSASGPSTCLPLPPSSYLTRNSDPSQTSSLARRRRRTPPLAPLSRSHEETRVSASRPNSSLSSSVAASVASSSKTLELPHRAGLCRSGLGDRRVVLPWRPNFAPLTATRGRSASPSSASAEVVAHSASKGSTGSNNHQPLAPQVSTGGNSILRHMSIGAMKSSLVVI